ncbi:MAG: hypothetical protein ACKPE1_21410, partial [Dolichospermum sp.]
EFVEETCIPQAHLNLLQALPNTAMWNRLQTEGRLRDGLGEFVGSQKALMLPPGLAFLALSERAHEQRKRSNIPNFYFNLAAEDKAAVGGETAWTPAVSLICGLDVVLTQL